LFGAINSKLGSRPPKPTNCFVPRTGIYLRRWVISHHWNPTKKEIEEWLDKNIHELATQENRNLHLPKE